MLEVPLRMVFLFFFFFSVGALSAQDPSPVGGEFQINSYTTDFQGYAAVASDSTGAFVVAWHSDPGLDGSETTIHMRRFDAARQPLGDDVQVNTTGTFWQSFPDIASSDASFVVTWSSRPAADESYVVRARPFASDGTPINVELQPHATMGGDQRFSRVAMDAAGGFVVVWQDESGIDGDDFGIQARRYDSIGAALGGQFHVNTSTAGRQGAPRVAMNDAGAFVVLWQDGLSDPNLRARRFDSTGTAIGGDFAVNGFVSGDQGPGAVAMAADGSWLVAYESSGSPGSDDDGRAILARRFASDGTPIAADFQVNTLTASEQRQPAVSAAADGGFVVVWSSFGADGDAFAVRAQRLDSTGAPIGGEIAVNSYTTAFQQRPAITTRGDDFLVVWESGGGLGGPDGSITAIRGQAFATDPSPTLTIPAQTPIHAGGRVTLPVELDSDGLDIAGVAFSVDYDEACLDFDAADLDADGLPDDLVPAVPAAFQTTAFVDLGDSDGEIDITVADVAPPVDSLPGGALLTLSFTATCDPAVLAPLTAAVSFSSDPAPSFSDPQAVALAGTSEDGSVLIYGGLRGDCNGNDLLDAADLIACGLEIFDGDGASAWQTPGGGFAGNPVGCDAQGDLIVDAGDLACKNRLLFGLLCGGARASAGGDAPRLLAPREVIVDSTGEASLIISLESAGHDLVATAFSLDIDGDRLRFDPTDSDGDGLPDAVILLDQVGSIRSVSFDGSDTDGEIDVLFGDLAADPMSLGDGALFELRFEALAADPGSALLDAVRFSPDPAASFGGAGGSGIAGFAVTFSPPLFADGFESGDLSAWDVVP